MKKLPYESNGHFTWSPEIHDDDAISAIRARFSHCKDESDRLRKLEGMFLDSIANPKNGELSKSQAESIVSLRDDKDFMEKFARAMTEGRMPPFSNLEIYILKNWRGIQSSDGPSLPGLWEWGPKAATEFLFLIGLHTMTAEAYIGTRKRLGLKPKKIRVTSVRKLPGKHAIEIETKD